MPSESSRVVPLLLGEPHGTWNVARCTQQNGVKLQCKMQYLHLVKVMIVVGLSLALGGWWFDLEASMRRYAEAVEHSTTNLRTSHRPHFWKVFISGSVYSRNKPRCFASWFHEFLSNSVENSASYDDFVFLRFFFQNWLPSHDLKNTQ